MTAAAYTTDLTLMDDASASTGWSEPGKGAWESLKAATYGETDDYVQNTTCHSATVNAGVGGLLYNNGAGITLNTDDAVLCWAKYDASGTLATEASGGVRTMMGSSTTDYYGFSHLGSDSLPYGMEWTCLATGDPADTSVSPDYTVGTPTTTKQYHGWAYNAPTSVPAKGNPWKIDAIRYGRCEFRVNGGDATNGYATFSGMAATNDANTTGSFNRWGLFQSASGGYLWKGLMTLGYVSAIDFRDSNAVINIENTKHVTPNFNKIEIRQATSRVDWTSVTMNALGTASPGRFEVIDNADVNLQSCVFNDMDTFVFLANSAALGCVWNRCGRITNGGADMDGSSILESTVAADEGALFVDETIGTSTTLTDLDNMTFSKGTNAHHAIRFGTGVTANITLNNLDFSGFGTSDDANDSVFRFDATSGSLTLSLVGCSHDGSGFTVDDAAGITVTVSIDPVTVQVNVSDNNGDRLNGARVYLEAANATGDLPYQQSITSITQTAGAPWTRTVTFAAAHGLETGDYLNISGITNATVDNYGAFQVTYSSPTVVTYTSADSGFTTFTGTIIGTGALLHGETSGTAPNDGVISISRTFTTAQPVTGRVRKATASPRFKTFPLSGTVSTTNGLTINVQLILDE